ncbi:hypothetical protein JTB14_013921 [Gonioctena quinquepunctata]|nr:hypothetical protein JTB14_013921 [Gonioctena quinquepunctata]
MMKPDVVFDVEDYHYPKLDWIKLFIQGVTRAEILAAFEFIEVVEGKTISQIKSTKKNIFEIPPSIKPNLVPHKIEVLFWGVRDLGKVNLFRINRPRITVFCGDIILNSDTIENAARHANFSDLVKSANVILPDILILKLYCKVYCLHINPEMFKRFLYALIVMAFEQLQWSTPTSMNELNIALARMKLRKAPGPDQVFPEFLKNLGNTPKQWLLNFFN